MQSQVKFRASALQQCTVCMLRLAESGQPMKRKLTVAYTIYLYNRSRGTDMVNAPPHPDLYSHRRLLARSGNLSDEFKQT